jgi:hypothetical protein
MLNAFEPNYEGSPIVFGPSGSTCNALGPHAFKARAGHHIAPQPLSSGRNVFEELGEGFTLLALDADDATLRGWEQTAAAVGIPLKVIHDSRSGGRENYEASLILVRPDQFVTWTSEGDRLGPTEILTKAVGR